MVRNRRTPTSCSMPIFQADLDNDRRSPPETQPLDLGHAATRLRRLSEESLRTELCEGPVPDSPPQQGSSFPERSATDRPITPSTDRVDLIERLKRVQSPSWLADRRVSALISSKAPSVGLHRLEAGNIPTIRYTHRRRCSCSNTIHLILDQSHASRTDYSREG